MHGSSFGVEDGDMEEQPNHESDIEQQVQMDDTQLGAEDGQTNDAWKIRITSEMKRQLAGP